jgi:hypothetical protein
MGFFKWLSGKENEKKYNSYEEIEEDDDLSDVQKRIKKRVLYYNNYLEALLPAIERDLLNIDNNIRLKREYSYSPEPKYEEPENPEDFNIYDFDKIWKFRFDADENKFITSLHAQLCAIKDYLEHLYDSEIKMTNDYWRELDYYIKSSAEKCLYDYNKFLEDKIQRENEEKEREERIRYGYDDEKDY